MFVFSIGEQQLLWVLISVVQGRGLDNLITFPISYVSYYSMLPFSIDTLPLLCLWKILLNLVFSYIPSFPVVTS